MKKNFTYKRTYVYGLTGIFVIVSFFLFMLIEKNSCANNNTASYVDSFIKTQCNKTNGLQAFLPFLNQSGTSSNIITLEEGESEVFSTLENIIQTNGGFPINTPEIPLFGNLKPEDYGLTTNDLEEMFSRQIPYSRLIQFIVYWTLGIDTVIQQDFLSENNKSTVAKYIVNVIPYWIYLIFYLFVFITLFLGWMFLIRRFFSKWTRLEKSDIFNSVLNTLFGITKDKNKFLFPHYAPVIQKIMWLFAVITALRIVQIFFLSRSTVFPFFIRNTAYYVSYQENLHTITQTATDLKEFYTFPFLLLFYGIFKVYPRFNEIEEREYIKRREKDIDYPGFINYLNHKFTLTDSNLRCENIRGPEQTRTDKNVSTNTGQIYREEKRALIQFDDELIQIRRLLDAFRIKELYPAQHEFIQKILNKESVILAANRFSGKTSAVLIATIMEFLLNGKKTLFIVNDFEKGRILEERFFDYFEDSFWIKQILKVSNARDFENESNIEHTPDITIATLEQWESVTSDIINILKHRKSETEAAKNISPGKLFEQILCYQTSEANEIKAEQRWLDFMEGLSLVIVLDLNNILFDDLETVDNAMAKKFQNIMRLYSDEFSYFKKPTFAMTCYPYEREHLLEIINNRLTIPVSENAYIAYNNPTESNISYFSITPTENINPEKPAVLNIPAISNIEKHYITEQPLAYYVAAALFMDIYPILIIESKYLISRRFLKIVKEIHSNLYHEHIEDIENKVIFSDETSNSLNLPEIKMALFAGEAHRAVSLPYYLKYLRNHHVMALIYLPYSDQINQEFFKFAIENSDILYKQKRLTFAEMPNEDIFTVKLGQDIEYRIPKIYLQLHFPPQKIFSCQREHYKVIDFDIENNLIRLEKNFEKYIIPSSQLISSAFPFIIQTHAEKNEGIFEYGGRTLPVNISVKYKQNFGPSMTEVYNKTLNLGNDKSRFNIIIKSVSNQLYTVEKRTNEKISDIDIKTSRLFNTLLNLILAGLYENYAYNIIAELHSTNNDTILLLYDLFPDNQDKMLVESIQFELRNNIDSHSVIFANMIRLIDKLINRAASEYITGPSGKINKSLFISIKDFLTKIRGREKK